MKRRIFSVLMAIFAVISCVGLSACFDIGDVLNGVFGSGDHSHRYEKTVVKPTCTQGGYTLYECSCGISYKSNAVPASGHKEIKTEGKAASCSSGGFSDGTKCSVCGEVVTEQQYIPALEHEYEAKLVNSEEVYVCKECGAQKTAHVHKKRKYAETQNRDECAECNSAYKIKAAAGNGLYGYYDFYYTDNGAAKQSLYYDMYILCEAFAAGEKNVSAVNENGMTFYPAGYIDLKKYALSSGDIYAVWKVFYMENPAYYWLDNACFYYTQNGVPTRLPLCIYGDYAQYQVRRECDADISAMADECLQSLSAYKTQTRKAVAVHDYIIGRIDYAYDNGVASTESWAHNITGVASAFGGVCEAYAKTYLYLCNLGGVECLIVSGVAANAGKTEGHAWNLIDIDGKWYTVDATWDDNGANPVSYKYMGAAKWETSATHLANTTSDEGVNYLYILPDISGTRLNLNNLTRNGNV